MLKINKNTTPVYEEDSNVNIGANVGEMILNQQEMKRIFDILAKDADRKKDCLIRL